MTAASSADRPRTYGDLRRWGDDTRWEIIDGQAYAMTGPSWQHQSVTAGLVAQLLAYFRAHGCRVLPASSWVCRRHWVGACTDARNWPAAERSQAEVFVIV